MLNAGEPEKILEISEFSMLRLHDIAEQRNLYSSVDDIVYAHDSDSDFDEPYENSKQITWVPRIKYVHEGFKFDVHIPAVKYEGDCPDKEINKIVRPW